MLRRWLVPSIVVLSASIPLIAAQARGKAAAPAPPAAPALEAPPTPVSWFRHPALSPDGRWIAFCAYGDLWVVASSGGDARPLTRGEFLETRPVWAPDGASLAYASDRHGNFDVFTVPVDGGTERRLTTHSAGDYPWAFTPDGKRILFSSGRMGLPKSRLYPGGWPGEVYSVSLEDGQVRGEGLFSAEQIDVGPQGWLYERVVSIEDEHRKHHTSSAARELWLRKPDGGNIQVTRFAGEDREPVWRPAGGFWFISERDGCLNVFAGDLDGSARQLTRHQGEPVRGLSASRDGLLCYSQGGCLWTLREGGEPAKLDVRVAADRRAAHPRNVPLDGEITEAALSPDGKEMAFIAHGEVFVCSVEHGTTRRITDTPEQERNLSFAPDGRGLAYAGERRNCWRIFRATLPRKEDLHFFNAVEVAEEVLVDGPDDCFKPAFSPDGKRLAYLARRTELRVLELPSRAISVLLPEKLNYSYSDSDQWFEWAPDGQWLAFHFPANGHWIEDIGLVALDGKCLEGKSALEGGWSNLTLSGHEEYCPRWTADGRALVFFSDRLGMKAQGGWGGQDDIYLLGLSREGMEWYQFSEEELAARQEADSLAAAAKEEAAGKKKGKSDEAVQEDEVKVRVELAGVEDRVMRLTTSSAMLADFWLSKDGETLYTLARYTKGLDLYETKIRKGETRLLGELGLQGGGFIGATDGALFLLSADGRMIKFDLGEEAPSDVACSPEMTLRQDAEWAYQFDHVWRQVREKFYSASLHGADWPALRRTYLAHLPGIDHERDFTECLSELLGELNASHTGSYVNWRPETGDATADLGLLFDPALEGPGLRVAEVLADGPCARSDSRVRAGHRLLSIDGKPLANGEEAWLALNRRAGSRVRLRLADEKGAEYDQVVVPGNAGSRQRLLYERWIRRNVATVDSLSHGRLGYVHIEAMEGPSYTRLVQEALGRCATREALVVDTRHNSGGNLTNELVAFLGGKRTYRNVVRPNDHVLGEEPGQCWLRPTIVLMNETNYSDAHCFPFAYRHNQMGKLVGMPVAGTGTSVWWETLMGGRITFGIPEVGLLDESGRFLENQQLEPDLRVDNGPDAVAAGRDPQLEAAVVELLRQLDGKK